MKYRIVYTGVGPLPYRVDMHFTEIQERQSLERSGKTEDPWILIAKEATHRQCYDAIKAHSGENQIILAEIET